MKNNSCSTCKYLSSGRCKKGKHTTAGTTQSDLCIEFKNKEHTYFTKTFYKVKLFVCKGFRSQSRGEYVDDIWYRN